MIKYGFTIHEIKRTNDQKAYCLPIKTLCNRGKIVDFVWEDRKKNGDKTSLHVHGVVELPKRVLLSSLCIPGFSTKFEQIYDLARWNQYMNKNVMKPAYQIPQLALASPVPYLFAEEYEVKTSTPSK